MDPQEVEGLQYEDENDNLMMSEVRSVVPVSVVLFNIGLTRAMRPSAARGG